MSWCNPLPLKLVPTDDSLSYEDIPDGYTGLPLTPHPGAFAIQRKFHIHEGVDLYAPVGTPVFAVEAGEVVAVIPFTGEHAGYPHWENTWAVLVEGETGVVVYGEIQNIVEVGDKIQKGQWVGSILRVLKNDKGRPMSMLHLELYEHGARDTVEWTTGPQAEGHLDPTPYLLKIRK